MYALSSWLLLTYLILNSMMYCLPWTDESAEEGTGGVWQEGWVCSDLSYSGHLGTLQVREWKDRTMICRSENVELIYATGQKLGIVYIFWKKSLLFTHGCFYIIKIIDYFSLQYHMNVWGKKDKIKINTFIQQGCIKLIKSDSKDIYNVSIHLWILENKMYHCFHKNIGQHSCVQHW